MKRLIPLVFLSLLTGCETTSVSDTVISPISTHATGYQQGAKTTLYWYTSQQNQPVKLAEVVTAEHSERYESEYRWRDGKLREIKRQGTRLGDEHYLVPFTLHLRYDAEGQAVYQRFTQDGSVLPLSDVELYAPIRQVDAALRVIAQQRKAGLSLVQGYWQQQHMILCGEQRAKSLTFNTVAAQAAASGHDRATGYMALTGKVRRDSIEASQVLLLADNSQQCLVSPVLLDPQ
ncbi:DUF1481 domain-containing protein [Photobacterium sp. TY1-4]|uniref:DUF1481 domain-containing protein n=1 Tax=Photobacterium sp. TY1-4 TaxID=2899122 RepID=UPI0021C1A4AF|nr:DUF1481 domain-containing protein [Photobacterium sp. TY1-4]UXI01138.1 DUF1481 domain-containing protein [Photobacterium sp. TY1-4]